MKAYIIGTYTSTNVIGNKHTAKHVTFNLYHENELKIFPIHLSGKHGNHIQYIDKITDKRASLTDTSFLCYEISVSGMMRFEINHPKYYSFSKEATDYIKLHFPEVLL